MTQSIQNPSMSERNIAILSGGKLWKSNFQSGNESAAHGKLSPRDSPSKDPARSWNQDWTEDRSP
jgi:hypothetical protein